MIIVFSWNPAIEVLAVIEKQTACVAQRMVMTIILVHGLTSRQNYRKNTALSIFCAQKNSAVKTPRKDIAFYTVYWYCGNTAGPHGNIPID
jgi:hypothetical protein